MKLFNFIQNKLKKNKGFTLLFAVVISALVLAIGLSVANITMKQVQLSSVGRESQIAFYAADSGSECAIYYDLTKKAFPDPDNSFPFNSDNVKCGDGVSYAGGGTDNQTTFDITYGSYCSLVTVSKNKGDDNIIHTTILSRGYNTCDESSPRKLERGLQITY